MLLLELQQIAKGLRLNLVEVQFPDVALKLLAGSI